MPAPTMALARRRLVGSEEAKAHSAEALAGVEIEGPAGDRVGGRVRIPSGHVFLTPWRYTLRKGSTITRPPRSWPCWRSSVYKVWQPERRAAATTSES